MRLIHLTDPHLTVPPPAALLKGRSHFGKRFLGRASWARKRRLEMRRQWLDELTDAVLGLEPARILISGDLTQIGTAEEIAEARSWLEGLAAPERLVLVPGNHDVYARESGPLVEREWGPYLKLAESGCNGHWPTLQRVGGLGILGVNTALPTPPLSASGVAGPDQLERLEARLVEARDSTPGGFTLLLLHHPPLPGQYKFRKRLRDAKALARLLERYRVPLVLHGHEHRNRSLTSGPTRVLCTGSAATEDASFRLLDIDASGAGWSVEAGLMMRAGKGFRRIETERWTVSAPG